MTPFETVRLKILTHVKSFHTASYSAMKVDYPNLTVVDPEKDPEFVKVELDMEARHLDLSARRCVRISGYLYLSHYKKCGFGMKNFVSYSDTLFTYLGLKTLDGVTYYEVKPYNRSGLPGFDTTMNSVRFQFDYFA